MDDGARGPNGTIDIPHVDAGSHSNAAVNNNQNIECLCGKLCKRIKGLRIHQRSCRVLDGFDEDEDQLHEKVEDESIDTDHRTEISLNDYCLLKPGIRPPISEEEWLIANQYFQSVFSVVLRFDVHRSNRRTHEFKNLRIFPGYMWYRRERQQWSQHQQKFLSLYQTRTCK